jgi:undecaprenyl phosphate N,N'-diacetylbacillosamine 1-phosphate transferase
MYKTFAKRLLDFTVAFLIVIIILPLMLLIAIILRISLEGSPFFTQLRPGKNGNIFKFYKFRTMTNSTDENGVLLADNERMTKIGNVLRHTSLDELLSFWNVLKGDMSLVGPRPLLDEYLPLYSPEQSRRHDVKPGVTGWAQINGRNAISWEEKFQYDVWYVDNQSFFLDIRIILLTVSKVFKREGVNSGTSITMEKFKGNIKGK